MLLWHRQQRYDPGATPQGGYAFVLELQAGVHVITCMKLLRVERET